MAEAAERDRRGAWAAGLLGFAFGGFLDGILLHQVLQWHHLLSGWEGRATLEQLRFHTFWDGIFHAAHYAILAAGLALLWARPGAGPVRLGLGWFAIGFGAWHVLDAVVNHWALGLHRIRQDSPQPLLWDLVFFGLGAAALALGWARRRGPGRLRSGAAAALVLLAGAGAALPARGPAFAALTLPEGAAGPESAMRLAAAAGADLVGADAAGGVWLFRTAEPRRLARAALAQGARPAPLPRPAAGGCLSTL
jgi:uncharacterized membrane protein